MNLLNRRGTFHAVAQTRGVDTTGDNKLLTLMCSYSILEEYQGPEAGYVDIQAEAMEISGWHYIEQKDGSINERTHGSIMKSFGWDGKNPFDLVDKPEFGEKVVQIVCDFEEFEGKTKIKVQWLNPENSTGGAGITNADETKRRAVLARLGGKFRALVGPGASRPATPPAPPVAPAAAAAPATPTRPSGRPSVRPAAAATAPAPARTSNADEAWKLFAAACDPKCDQAWMETEWFRVLGFLFGDNKKEDTFTAQDWGRVVTEGIAAIIPF